MKIQATVLLFVLILSGCTQLWQQQKIPVNPDLPAFEQAFSLFQETGQLAALESFIAAYPDSAWAARAASIAGYVRALEKNQGLLQEQQADMDEQAQQMKKLRQENDQLVETIDLLKGSLIELEKRPL